MIRLLEENKGHKLHDSVFGNDFLNKTKIKIFCISKDTINRVKRQSTKLGKYLQITYLINTPKIHREHLKFRKTKKQLH